MAGWNHLRLIKNHNAVGDVVKLAALGRTVGVEGLKELHSGGDDDGGIPVFGGQPLKVIVAAGFVVIVVGNAAVMLYNVGFSQYVPEYLGVLLNDGGIGNDVNHTFHAVFNGVFQPKRQRGYGFSTTGGHRQRVDASGAAGLAQAGRKNGTSIPVQFCVPGEPGGNIIIQSMQEIGQGIISAALRDLFCHKELGIQKICIYQAGIHHPCPHGDGEEIVKRRLFAGIGQFSRPMIRGNTAGLGFFNSAYKGWGTRII